MSTRLSVDKISKDYFTGRGPLRVLDEASLGLSAGESAAITGPSGSGKSTLLNIIGTLETPTSGSIRIGDQNPFDLRESALARYRNLQIGFVFQDHHLLPHCSVLENVLIPTYVEGSGEERIEWARQLLKRVGLSDRLEHRPAELSGGERQRVAVARALINSPGVLLADEPTGNLDRATARTVAELILGLHREEKAILIVVTHSAEIADMFERRYELSEGALSLSTSK